MLETTPEEKIPDACKFIEAEVLKFTCPLQVAQLASGEHQQAQSDIHKVTTHNVATLLVEAMQRSQAILDGDALFQVIKGTGVVVETRPSDEGKRKTAKSADLQLVCSPPFLSCFHGSVVHRRTTTMGCTVH
jgi:hypothetical protein